MENDTTTTPTPLLLERTNLCFYCGEIINPDDVICDDCDREKQEFNEKKKQEADAQDLARRVREFNESCGAYGDVDPTKLPDTAAYRAASGLITGGSRGLTIAGPSRTGKTYSAVWAARREVQAGLSAEFINSAELRASVGHSRDILRLPTVSRLMRVGILILDDFGNNEFSRAGEELFQMILERRHIRRLRTFVTTQYTPDQLRVLMNTTQTADAICRRIGVEFNAMGNTATGEVKP